MRRLWKLSFWLGMTTLVSFGCNRTVQPGDDDKKSLSPRIQVAPLSSIQVVPPAADKNDTVPGLAPPTALSANQEKYESALTEALTLMADRKYGEALVFLEAARTLQDNDFIKGEIAKVQARLEQTGSAQQTIQDIETILGEGKADDAAKLAGLALKEFGDGEAADHLVKLRLQADALRNAANNEEAAARYQHFRDEGEAALREKNLRAAALAFEQANLAREDRALTEKLTGIRADLEKYDSLRKRAAELRRDPAQLEDALGALKDAAQAWDTLQIRQEIDEYTLALQKRRPTISVADFEIRGDLGIPDAGSAFAEELLPLLKRRFDLVERGQISKVLNELKLEAGLLNDSEQQREVGRLAKVRYLVLGSVTRLAGLTVNARLVDMRTGLIVQTAKITAPSVEEIVPLLPVLAQQLQMSDEEKMAYEQEHIRLAKRPELPPENAPLPPLPEPPGANQPPPPLALDIPLPPDFAGLRIEAFRALPVAPPAGAVVQFPLAGPGELRVKHRLLQAVLHLGDNLFRRGHYREAQRHYDFALTLAPGEFDVRLRVERCLPFLPPQPLPVIVQQPVIFSQPRPRIAILNFMTVGDPVVVPPGLGPWTAANMAPYFGTPFEVVDLNEVYWYMGRLGMTMGDLMQDPSARRWLGRALNVRYFVLGTLEQTTSFDAATYMLDAEYGFLQGSGRIHVRNSNELKLRLAELAGMTQMDPNARNRFLVDSQRFEVLVLKGRQATERGEFAVAVTVFEDALKIRPGNVEVLAYLDRSRYQARQLAWEVERRRQIQAEEAARRRQWECAQAAESARLRAVREGALQDAAERARQEQLRRRAQEQLLAQARLTVTTRNVGITFGLFEGAMGLASPSVEVVREFAGVRAEKNRMDRDRTAQETSQREAALAARRLEELNQARRQVEEERQRGQAALETQKKIQRERDTATYQRGFDEAQRLLARGDYDAAIGVLQLVRPPAQDLGKANLVDALLTNALLAQAKGTQRAELEKKFADERDRRRQAEQEAKQKDALYQAALVEARQAQADKKWDLAQAKYQQAGKLFETDTVLSGLRGIETARAQAQAQADAAQKKAAAENARLARLQSLLDEGKKAHASQKYQEAITILAQAQTIAPENVDVLTALTQAQQARDNALADSRRQAEATGRTQNFQKLLKNGQDNLAAKQVDAAIANLTEALKIVPDDATARNALAQAQNAQDALSTDSKTREANRQKAADYQKLLGEGRTALAGKRFDDALQAFAKAQSLLPGDKTSSSLLEEARAQKQNEAARLTADAKKKADDLHRAADLEQALSQGRSALAGKNFAAAEKAFSTAAQLDPKDPGVVRALQDLQKAKNLAQSEAETEKKRQQAIIDNLKTQNQEQAKLLEFNRLLKAAAAAMAGKNYSAAQKSYADALKLNPLDATAQRGLQDAGIFLEKINPPPPMDKVIPAPPKDKVIPPPPPSKDKVIAPLPNIATLFQKEMQNGAALEKEKKYPEALKSYQLALKLISGDAKAKEAAVRTELTIRLADGQKYLDTMKYAEAIREFEAALVLSPNNPAVTKLLARAMQMKK